MKNELALFLIIFCLHSNIARSQKAGLQLYILSSEDSTQIENFEVLLYKSSKGRPLISEAIEKNDSITSIYYVDSSDKYLFCFSANIEGCYEEFFGENCFEYNLEQGKVVQDTLWSPLISRVMLIPSAKVIYLYYVSRKPCNGYIKTYFKNSTGTISYEGNFKHGIPRGVHLSYHENGTICEKIEYSKKGKVKKRRFGNNDF